MFLVALLGSNRVNSLPITYRYSIRSLYGAVSMYAEGGVGLSVLGSVVPMVPVYLFIPPHGSLTRQNMLAILYL